MRFWGERGSRTGPTAAASEPEPAVGSAGNDLCAGEVGSDLCRGASSEGLDVEPERERVVLPPPSCRGKSPMHEVIDGPLLPPPPPPRADEDELPALAFGIVAERGSFGTGGLTGEVGSSAANEAACIHL